jgi:hypothetical protein
MKKAYLLSLTSGISRDVKRRTFGAAQESLIVRYLKEVMMRKLLIIGISAASACLLYSNAASAFPGAAPKSLAPSASIGVDLFQQVHSRKHRHRHRHYAYRGYRGYPIGSYPYAAYSYPVYVPLYYGHHLGGYYGHHLGGHLSSGHNFGGHLQHHGHH